MVFENLTASKKRSDSKLLTFGYFVTTQILTHSQTTQKLVMTVTMLSSIHTDNDMETCFSDMIS